MVADARRASLEASVTLVRESRPAAHGTFSLEVAFEAPPGFTIVSGPSGAGKSTLLGAIAGFLRPRSGRIALGDETWFDSERRVNLAPERRGVAIVFQSLALFPHLTAAQNVAYGIPGSLDRASRRVLVEALLERFRVTHLAHRKPPTFSGGEAQRLALARALASNPRVLLLDEPFSALDAALRRDLAAEVRETLRELGIPVVFVTHQPDEARREGDRTVTLALGRIVPPASVQ
jgi:molybdate transport system ATP-binding protein